MKRLIFLFALSTMLFFSVNAFAQIKLSVADYNETCVSAEEFRTPGFFDRYKSSDISRSSAKTRNAVKAINNVYDFFEKEYNWPSTDGKNRRLYLSTNLAYKFKNEYCSGINAFCSGPDKIAILYGKKGGSLDIASDIDVVAHEFTHGIFYSRQIRFSFLEHGALNESIADMLGITARAWMRNGQSLDNIRTIPDDYLSGKIISKIKKSAGEISTPRNLSNPQKSNQPDHYREIKKYDEEHAIGGITNLAFYLLSEGGSHPRKISKIHVHGIGIKKAANIIFYTLRHLPFMEMKDFAKEAQKAARKIYGLNSAEEKATHNAFAAVGLFDAAFVPASVPKPSPKKPSPKPAPETDTILVSTKTIISVLLLIVGGLGILVVRKLMGKRDALAGAPVQGHNHNQSQDVMAARLSADSETGATIELEIDSVRFPLRLDESPVTIGRHADELPSAFMNILKSDETVSRQHCELWYKAETDELYVRNLSNNGTHVNDISLRVGEKGKVRFNQAIDLKVGRTHISLRKMR